MPAGATYNRIYARLLKRYGAQDWWPADDPFEVAVGAVLTQGTAWLNAARAVEALKQSKALNPRSIAAMPESSLAATIRPAGFHNVKAGRLKGLTGWWLASGGRRGIQGMTSECLRDGLLGIRGIGGETADAIMLYAFERRVFVVDAYARRVFSRIGLIDGDEKYESLRLSLERTFNGAAAACNEYHALIVEHGKTHCRPQPRCNDCCLADVCVGSRVRC